MTEYQSHIIMAGYSPSAKIRSPCALQASLQIFGWRMRTDAAYAARSASSPPQPTEKATLSGGFFCWLGWPDSDRRMRESKSRALPLGDIPLRSRSASALREKQFYKCQLLTLKFSSTEGVPLSEEFTTEIKVFPRLMVSFSPPIPEITRSDVSLERLQRIGTYLPSEI